MNHPPEALRFARSLLGRVYSGFPPARHSIVEGGG
jgi:hypothetical protein